MKRSPMKPRSSALRRLVGVRKRNAKRRASEFHRCFHSKARVEWVKSLPCVVPTCRTMHPIRDNMHVEGDGVGRRADFTKVVPACRFHHELAHREGIEWFE